LGISFRELLIILAIALLVFGAKRLKTIGSDLGSAVRGFKQAMSDGEQDADKPLPAPFEVEVQVASTPADKAGNRTANV
jgi:sec-independent protein translocase protein TatA